MKISCLRSDPARHGAAGTSSVTDRRRAAPSAVAAAALGVLALLGIACGGAGDTDEETLESPEEQLEAAVRDECNTTSDCTAKHGPKATDCKDSRSTQSVCMCGPSACGGAGGGPSPEEPQRPGGGGTSSTDTVVTIEVESIAPQSPWVKRTALSGYSGTAYFEWTGRDNMSTPPEGVLTYRFNIKRAGTYLIGVRGRRDQSGVCAGAPSDACNDVFSRIDGASWEKTMVKGPWGEWFWDEKWEPGASVIPHEVNLSAGDHTISLGGRSKGVKIDAVRIRLKGATPPSP
jgi:hypothetical protein